MIWRFTCSRSDSSAAWVRARMSLSPHPLGQVLERQGRAEAQGAQHAGLEVVVGVLGRRQRQVQLLIEHADRRQGRQQQGAAAGHQNGAGGHRHQHQQADAAAEAAAEVHQRRQHHDVVDAQSRREQLGVEVTPGHHLQEDHADDVEQAVEQGQAEERHRVELADGAAHDVLLKHHGQAEPDQQPVVAVDLEQAEIERVASALDLVEDFSAMGQHRMFGDASVRRLYSV